MGSIKGNQYTGYRMVDCLNEIVSVALRRMVRLTICMPIRFGEKGGNMDGIG